MNIMLTDQNKSIEEFNLLEKMGDKGVETFKDNLQNYFSVNPVVYCNRCLCDYTVKQGSELYIDIGSKITEYPVMVPFEKCCQVCRDEEACYYETALLADEMIEYEVADKKWFFKEVSIEKRWKQSRQEIQNRAILLRTQLTSIL